ncbi:MAG: transcription elongation factor GreA [Patescibacteria group bacterium]
MIKKIPFTQSGFDKIKQEYAEITSTKKLKAIDRLQKARAMGDLSENSEYTAAKEDLSFVEGRIRELEEIMKNAEVVEHHADENTVDVGCKVIVEINGKQDAFYIVGEFEANPMEKKLSQTSPIGKALFGKKKGDVVEVQAPAGMMKYKIVDIQES